MLINNPLTIRISDGHATYSAENAFNKQTIHYTPIKLYTLNYLLFTKNNHKSIKFRLLQDRYVIRLKCKNILNS